MASQVWLLLLRGGRLDTSKHGRFTVNASLRWPMPTSVRPSRAFLVWLVSGCFVPNTFGTVRTSAPAASQSSCNVPLIAPVLATRGATRQAASAKSDAPVPSILVANGAIERLRLSTLAHLPRSSYPSRFTVGEPKCHIRPS